MNNWLKKFAAKLQRFIYKFTTFGKYFFNIFYNIMTNSNIAIFISGTGSNFRNLFSYFSTKQNINISLLISSNPNSPALSFADEHRIPTMIITKSDLCNPTQIINLLHDYDVDLIVLAGFLWLIPRSLIIQYPQRIINIHPALLPKYGGKGMYGEHVHQTVWLNKEAETGITIHYVNENYDEGNIIFQASCPISTNDTPDDIANKVHQLEYQYFPKIVEKIATQK